MMTRRNSVICIPACDSSVNNDFTSICNFKFEQAHVPDTLATWMSLSQDTSLLLCGGSLPGYWWVQFSSVQSLSRVRLFATPWTAARQASLSITNSRSSPKLMSIELVMPSSHLILCHPLLLLPSIFPSIRVFFNESVLCVRWPKYWSFRLQIKQLALTRFLQTTLVFAIQKCFVVSFPFHYIKYL